MLRQRKMELPLVLLDRKNVYTKNPPFGGFFVIVSGVDRSTFLL